MTSDRTDITGKAAPGSGSPEIVIKEVTSEEYCALCVSRRTLHRSDVRGLRGLFEPATRTHFVEQPNLRRPAQLRA